MTEIDYDDLSKDVESGRFRSRLEKELCEGFESMQERGEPLPPASHYASRIAEIIEKGAPETLSRNLKWEIYQEVLAACQKARERVLGVPDLSQGEGGDEAQ